MCISDQRLELGARAHFTDEEFQWFTPEAGLVSPRSMRKGLGLSVALPEETLIGVCIVWKSDRQYCYSALKVFSG